MVKEPDFVSRQTYDARRFYLDLQPSNSHPLTVVCGGVERMNDDYVVERVDFPFFAIEWVSEGKGLLTMGGKRYELSVGTLFAYGPKIAHRIENVAPTNMRKYYLDLAGPEAESSLRGLGLLDGRPVSMGRSYELTELWDLIDREARDGSPHTAKLCESLARVLFQKIEQRIVSSEPGELPEALHTFEAIRKMMIDRFMEFPTIEDAAVAGGISPVYLSRLFKRFGGCGAYRFLLRLRMNYAAELLMDQGLKVVEVAEQLQYADAFQFSRAFKRVYDIPEELAPAFAKALVRLHTKIVKQAEEQYSKNGGNGNIRKQLRCTSVLTRSLPNVHQLFARLNSLYDGSCPEPPKAAIRSKKPTSAPLPKRSTGTSSGKCGIGCVKVLLACREKRTLGSLRQQLAVNCMPRCWQV